jgi:hypothetical protein
MRSLLPLLLLGCSTTRTLGDLADPQLRMPNHATGFVLGRERIDPNTVFRFGDASGQWSEGVAGGNLEIDGSGVWTDERVFPWTAADAVRIEGMPDAAAARIEKAKPAGALLERDGEAYVLSAPRPVLQRWLLELELAVARLQPEDVITIPGTHVILQEDDAKLYQLREIDRGASLGTWSLSSHGEPWQAAIHGVPLFDFLAKGRKLRIGWKWSEVARVQVDNVDGPKSVAAFVLASASIVSFVGIAPMLEHWPFWPDKHATSWNADLAPAASASAAPLFTTGARVRSIVRPVVTLDGAASIRGDQYYASGVTARVRFFDLFEIGGGAREAVDTGHRQTLGVFQAGFHARIDAEGHYAVPLGVDVGHGGDVIVDLRVPWGLRFSTGRWLATVLPASPQYIHLTGAPRRWTLASGVELGATF